MVTLLHKISSH